MEVPEDFPVTTTPPAHTTGTPDLVPNTTTRTARCLSGNSHTSWPRTAARSGVASGPDEPRRGPARRRCHHSGPPRARRSGRSREPRRARRARRARGCELLATRVDVGDRVALLAGNEPAFVSAYLGTLAAGAVAVPLNPAAPAHELARQLEIVAPALLVASPEHADRAPPSCVACRHRAAGARGRRRGERRADTRPPVARARRRSRGVVVHRGHGRAAEGRDAHARFAAREPRTAARPRRFAHRGDRCRARRAPVLPRLRLERRARLGAARGRVGRVGRSLPSGRGARTRAPRPRDRHRRGARGVRGVERARCRRRAGGRVQRGAACASPARPRSPVDVARADARALRRRRARGLRVDRSVAGRDDERGRGAASPGIDRSTAPGRRRAPRRHRGS